MTETELIKGCRTGNEKAQEELLVSYSRQMMGICYRYTGDADIARDLLHDGFIKVFTSFRSFDYRGEGSLRAWMSRIFVNTALEYLRHSHVKIEEVPLESIDTIEDIPNEEQLETIPNEVIMEMISELPQGYRAVFNMYVFEELSHREIAVKLGINEVSSRSQLSRSKKMLAERIKAYIRENE